MLLLYRSQESAATVRVCDRCVEQLVAWGLKERVAEGIAQGSVREIVCVMLGAYLRVCWGGSASAALAHLGTTVLTKPLLHACRLHRYVYRTSSTPLFCIQ